MLNLVGLYGNNNVGIEDIYKLLGRLTTKMILDQKGFLRFW